LVRECFLPTAGILEFVPTVDSKDLLTTIYVVDEYTPHQYMKSEHAKQIADLLNSRNQLVREYDANMVINAEDEFIYELKDDVVVACILMPHLT